MNQRREQAWAKWRSLVAEQEQSGLRAARGYSMGTIGVSRYNYGGGC